MPHKHAYTIDRGRFWDPKKRRYYDIRVCSCGSEKFKYV
jgi:hypothetical protein